MGSTKSSFLAVLLSLCSLSLYAGSVTLQAGAFKTEDEAWQVARELELTGLPISVRSEESAEKGLFHKVLLGNFETRAEADAIKADLNAKGISTFVRANANHDLSAVRAAINGTSTTDYFKTTTKPLASSAETSSSLVAEDTELKELLQKSTTSPETLRRFTGAINSAPDENGAKAKAILALGHYTFSGKSAYRGLNYDLSESRRLLLMVANGEIAAVAEDQVEAQEMLAHQLHYYTRDYIAALDAYRQVLASHIERGNSWKVAKTRAEIAATIYELAKVSGFNRAEAQNALEQQWTEATAHQEPYLNGETDDAMRVRNYTFRIGLMLTEILMEQKKWMEAKQIGLSLTQMYADFRECRGLMAESYCHLAKVGLNLRDKQLCYSAIAEAIKYGEMSGKTWGDVNRDPVWKAYALKNAGAFYFEESQETKDQIKAQMHSKFPEHPGLKTYFGGEER